MLFWAAAGARGQAPSYTKRWVFYGTNLLVEENVKKFEALADRAAKAGYNGIVLADYKLSILDRVQDWYPKNVARALAAADRAGIEVIPAIFSVGYSSGLLSHDPNLAEAMPAETVFVIQKGVGHLVADPAVGLKNGGLEQVQGDRFTGFGFQDKPGKITVADHSIAHGGKVACRMRDTATSSSGSNSRIVQKVNVHPHTCYRYSAWVKTQDLKNAGSFRLLALGTKPDGQALTFFEGGVEPTHDWNQISVVFNSLENDAVTLYAGIWGGSTGTMWIDDLALDEVPLTNVVRREGCPLAVTSSDGKTTYVEGKDFLEVVDPKLGQVPYGGEYEYDHDPPAFRVPRGSRIKEGQKVRVSWYHPVLVHGNQVMCCLSDPKVYTLLEDQARRVRDLMHSKTVFFSHDEIRVANWCKACQSRGKTPGAMLAENFQRCYEIEKSLSPDTRVVVWSDMFDPNHNAVDKYYLVNGTWAGSWEGVPKEVIIANWNGGEAAQSLRFFAARGHEQVIAGYYDVSDLSNFTLWNDAAKGVPGVIGFMYTTWVARFDLLEEYGNAIKPTAGARSGAGR
jgi:hypothetical protein